MLGQGWKESCSIFCPRATPKYSIQYIKPYLGGVHHHIFFKCTTPCPCPKGIPHLRLCCRLFTAWCWHWGATQIFWALVRQLFCSTSTQKKSVADLSRPVCKGITIATASPLAMLGQGCGCVVNKLEFFGLLEMSPQCKEL